MTEPIKLTDSLWCLPSRSMRYNAGVFAAGGRAWLIDPGPHPDEATAAADLAARLGARIDQIALTHSHWDHILGPERLPGLPTLAHEQFGPTLARNSEGTLAMIARWERRHGYTRAAPFALPAVDRVARDGEIIHLGELELRLLHIPGHAADQLAIFEPGAGALWAADTLSDNEIPFVSHNLTAYETTLARLAALPIRVLVPGHGRPSAGPEEIRGRIDADRRYLAELRARVAPVVAAGGSVEEALVACVGMTFREPEENAGPHRLNVESVYLELGGSADPDKVGWAQKGLIDE